MQPNNTNRIEEYQQQLFGKRFRGASLARTNLHNGSAEAIGRWLKKPQNFLIVTGPAGTGKTYLSAAILADIMEKLPRFRHVRAYSERTLLRKVRQSISDNSSGDYLEYLHSLLDDDFIIIDDVGSSGHTEWREEVLMEAIDFRYENMMPTMFTSNLSKQDFYEVYGQRIASRLFATENTIVSLDGMEDFRQFGK